ncbi:hypothetical protein F7Q99_25015 [Streptomyces kaniharaensis]|uniref:DUF4388 domain-containing protein n=1 Tax=Streptomyces kaniharaensis TaxID=212423 RepID=A0A6N7KY03_9ACTN|nr:hypothetical protein [Streptomyces kaniharaensis]MQS15439.1 hypothetical protein [Streptomyces kaniharaensis]
MSAHAAPVAVLPTVVPRTPGEAVGLLAARGATGALRGPLGSIYLVDGLVTHAESDRAPDLADLLTGCGRIAPEEWQSLVRVHGPHARVGEALIDQGRLTRGELELGHLGTLFDAAFFVLADVDGGLWRFEAGARHWLGPVTTVDAERLCRETERRQRLLDGIWPWPQLDTAPVRPAEAARRPTRRPPGRRRRELLDHADGRRTPAELARLLGRSGFGVTADVRRLAAAGLLDAPRHAAPAVPGPEPEPVPAPEPAPGQPARAPDSAPAGSAPEPAAGAAEPVPAPAPAHAPAPRTGGLHRRVPGATLTGAAAPGPTRFAHPPTPAAAHPLTVPDPDIALLTRVRTLLEARL